MIMVELEKISPASSAQMEKGAAKGSSINDDAFENHTGIQERALIRKLDRKLLPPVTLLYLLSFLDRSNVGNAKLEGLTTDLNMTGNQYLTGLTLFFIGYVLFEIPQNVALKRTSVSRLWTCIATPIETYMLMVDLIRTSCSLRHGYLP